MSASCPTTCAPRLAHARDAARAEAAVGGRSRRDPRGARRPRRRARARRLAHRAGRRGRADRAREAADAAHRRGRRPHPPRPLAQRPGADRDATVSARCDRRAARRGASRVAEALDELARASRTPRCPATRTCSRPCPARCRCGPAASPPRSATMPQGLDARAAPRRPQPARFGRRLRHAGTADRPRGHRGRASASRAAATR